MIKFIGFLGSDYGFMNFQNPFYPSLKKWMQLDSQGEQIKRIFDCLILVYDYLT